MLTSVPDVYVMCVVTSVQPYPRGGAFFLLPGARLAAGGSTAKLTGNSAASAGGAVFASLGAIVALPPGSCNEEVPRISICTGTLSCFNMYSSSVDTYYEKQSPPPEVAHLDLCFN